MRCRHGPDRVAAAGAVLGELLGWERANWYAPAGVPGRYEYAFGRQNWFEHSAAEHKAVREAFGGIECDVTVTRLDETRFLVPVVGPNSRLLLQSLPEPGTPPSWYRSGSYEIEIAGERVPADASLRPMYDPASERPRG